ncbi:hypothetical protein KP509_31G021400 [Ceratopteris richardii]|uniref:Glycosyltransferases n=1 Tax=Ceratopteris richardii TaxID=49495 RepID=A0A8T2QWE7_CERRI|nr:hypothetical protein KP509_31G021400 [Ceratopteris richardii]KAH7288306.1 hypothetical protein KP509_31G021400 [Ceratopteris richardii]
MTKLNRHWSNNRRGKAIDVLLRSSFSLLQFFFCVAALLLGFRLSREITFVVNSYKPSHDSFKSLRRPSTDVIFHDEVVLGLPYFNGSQKNITLPEPPRTPILSEKKSSRVHVGRHEILIRSWPHPHPVHIALAHQLVVRVQEEQRRTFGWKEKKQLLVITPTYVRACQFLYLEGLIHTLRAIPNPLIWIVVEIGGSSSETATLLADSQLSYYHLGLDRFCTIDVHEIEQVKKLARLEGLRFVGNHALHGIVLFADDINTYSLDYFEEAQKAKWVGFLPVGQFSSPGARGSFEEIGKTVKNQFGISQATSLERVFNESNSETTSYAHTIRAHMSFIDGGSVQIFELSLQAPVCNSSGHLVGWYLSSSKNSNLTLEWSGFAMNAKIFWKDSKKPEWIKDWTEALPNNHCMIESPLAFVKDASHVQPLGKCRKDVLMWTLDAEAHVDGKFPARWVISPPLDVVVPSKRTPWPELASPPPLLAAPPPPALNIEQANIRAKDAKGKRKRRSHRTKQSKTNKTLTDASEERTG